MKFQIIWKAFFVVTNEEKAIRRINQIELKTG